MNINSTLISTLLVPIDAISLRRSLPQVSVFNVNFVLLRVSYVIYTDRYTKGSAFLCPIVPGIEVEIGLDVGMSMMHNTIFLSLIPLKCIQTKYCFENVKE